MALVRKFRIFCESITQPNSKPPHTYECFAEGIKQCLGPFYNFILAKEKQVNELEQLVRPLTIAKLITEMEVHFQTISYLDKIYEKVILDFNRYPGNRLVFNM